MAFPPKQAGYDWRTLAITVLLGTIGGALFRWLTVPLPWMLGAVAFTTVAAMSGVTKISMPRGIRSGFITILGVLLGSSFTPTLVSRIHEWLWTAIGLLVWSLVAGAVAYQYLVRIARFDKVTAYFAATPGGLAEMVLIGSQNGANIPALALSHAVRVMLVVLTVPIWFRIQGMIPAQPSRSLVGLFDVAASDYAILGSCAVVGGIAAVRFRLPAATMLGPLLCSVAVHLSGLTESQPPYVLTSAAQVVLGTAIGQRFAGTSIRTIANSVGHATVATLLMLGLAVAFAEMFSIFTDQPFTGLVLAYAPGGFAEMSLMALALGIDTAFVASHHLLRIIVVVTAGPALFRRLHRSKGSQINSL
ncbi:MAG: AbrB family transcriptional regulator [Alphaproteobacteria bacterium]|nr:AbrB family transcriptional regulator [Alphaproteobacteria bacterium]